MTFPLGYGRAPKGVHMDPAQPTTVVAEALRAAQKDGLCTICGEPSSTSALALVPLCQAHLMSLDMVAGIGLLPKGTFRGSYTS
jgi:hypothetical protein